MRLGLCCLFKEEPIKFKTTTVTYLKKIRDKKGDWIEYVDNIVLNNVSSLKKAIEYCSDHNIGDFRINSNFLPCCTHRDTTYDIQDLPSSEKIIKDLLNIKEYASNKDVRLSFHPDQFVVLSSPNDDVVENSLKDIEYHTKVALLVGADTINIHGGGGYGDKEGALKRFRKSFSKLTDEASGLLTVENDDKVYTPEDLLPLCRDLSIPLVYDVHHHRCLKGSLTIDEATDYALKTWNREPLFHISSPINGWNEKHTNRHHDYIDIGDFPKIWLEIDQLTIEVEAKDKELAIAKLQHDLRLLEGV